MKPSALLVLVVTLGACADTVRSYDVEVGQDQLCRTFGTTPENCGRPLTPTTALRITIEDRSDGRAIIYGRSDTGEDRNYLAEVPRAGRYEVTELQSNRDDDSACVSSVKTTVALNVTDNGLEGGEEFRSEEAAECNELKERRITRRLRDWKGSRVKDE